MSSLKGSDEQRLVQMAHIKYLKTEAGRSGTTSCSELDLCDDEEEEEEDDDEDEGGDLSTTSSSKKRPRVKAARLKRVMMTMSGLIGSGAGSGGGGGGAETDDATAPAHSEFQIVSEDSGKVYTKDDLLRLEAVIDPKALEGVYSKQSAIERGDAFEKSVFAMTEIVKSKVYKCVCKTQAQYARQKWNLSSARLSQLLACEPVLMVILRKGVFVFFVYLTPPPFFFLFEL